MGTVLIVDDEYYIRVRVRKCIDWQAYGFDEILESTNGQEALAVLEKHAAALIIADISMPVMDGLALCKALRGRRYPAQVILLTGYDQFDYAKQAVSLDVIEYILKPVDGAEMERAVQKALERIHDAQSAQISHTERAELKSRMERMEKNIAFAGIFSGNYPIHHLSAEQLAAQGIDGGKTYRVFFSSELQRTNPKLTAAADVEVKLSQGWVWIIGEEDAAELLKDDSSGDKCMAIGVSRACEGNSESLHKAYLEARFIECQKILTPHKTVFRYDTHRRKEDSAFSEALKKCRASFDLAIRRRDTQAACGILEEALLRLPTEKDSIFELYRFLKEIQTDLAGLNSSKEELDALKQLGMSAKEILYCSKNQEEIYEHIRLQTEKLIENGNSLSDAGIGLVRNVQRYVNAHYMDEALSLDTVARAMALNASYLSDSFSKVSGQTLTRFITQVRMEKAMELLVAGNDTMTEIMEKVGYKDPYYFSKRFKRYFGNSPKMYRKK